MIRAIRKQHAHRSKPLNYSLAAAALLDRVLQHCRLVNIGGNSDRIHQHTALRNALNEPEHSRRYLPFPVEKPNCPTPTPEPLTPRAVGHFHPALTATRQCQAPSGTTKGAWSLDACHPEKG